MFTYWFCIDEFKLKIKNILLRVDFCNTLKKLNIINTPLPTGIEVIEARRVPHLCGTAAILSGVGILLQKIR